MITRVNGAAWGVGEKLTSAQINQMDLNATYALDKRAGQTDALASIVSCGGAGRIVSSYASGPDADTTFLLSGANSIINVTSLSTARAYTLSDTGALAGDRLMILNSTGFPVTVKNAGGATLTVLGPSTGQGADSGWGDFVWNSAAWVVMRSAKAPSPSPTTFTANGTWTCPRGVSLALLLGYGSGAGGGGGGIGTTVATTDLAGGGGGGGASQQMVQIVSVTPGTAYPVTVGAAASGGTSGANGSAGNDTTFDVLATFPGAAPGLRGVTATTAGTKGSSGGSTNRLLSSVLASAGVGVSLATLFAEANVMQRAPGSGGGAWNDQGFPSGTGSGSQQGFAGGVGSGTGVSSGTANGANGGGGGGGGPGGGGGAGGLGGAGASAGPAGTGVSGVAGAASTGAGGGGGGGGGQSTGGGAVGAGGAGGAGGSGQLTVIPLR